MARCRSRFFSLPLLFGSLSSPRCACLLFIAVFSVVGGGPGEAASLADARVFVSLPILFGNLSSPRCACLLFIVVFSAVGSDPCGGSMAR